MILYFLGFSSHVNTLKASLLLLLSVTQVHRQLCGLFLLTRWTLEQILASLLFTDVSSSCDHVQSQTFNLQNCDFVCRVSEMLQEYFCNSGSKHISLHPSEKMPEFVSISKI